MARSRSSPSYASIPVPILISNILKHPLLWRFVGISSSTIGLLCYALSSSFQYLYGKWTFLKIILYCVASLMISCIMLFPEKLQFSRIFGLKSHVVFLVLILTSLYSVFYDKSVNGKPDLLSLISNGAFALMSLSLSRQIELGLESGLCGFFLGCLVVQLIKINLILTSVIAVFCYSLIALRSCMDSKLKIGRVSDDDHSTIEIPTINEASFDNPASTELAERTSSSRILQPKRVVGWTEEEHKLFFLGLDKYGKGEWKRISREFVKTRTPAEVANHALKDFIKAANANRRRQKSNQVNISVNMSTESNQVDISADLNTEEKDNGRRQRMASLQAPPIGWPGAQGIQSPPIVKRVFRLDLSVDKYPNYNFVGRILGPRGNSLKRVEAVTECRVYIRGRGSVKDSIKEEKLKDKPGYEHLKEPLHVLVEAEFPEDIINARLDHAMAMVESLLKRADNGRLQRMASLQAPPIGWPGAQGIPSPPIVKRVVRLDLPVGKYPNYNFVGRILGPRGNSLKRVEAMTECRVYIRGRGSVKGSMKEEKLKDKPGYEHLKEPLHVLVEAEFPEDIINARLDHAMAMIEGLLKRADNGRLQRMASLQAPPIGWPGAQGIPSPPIVKRVVRLDLPVDKYPNYNFVGRILGPRGNSLKRVEAMTECRVYIRGRGSVKDSIKEEKLKDELGYEHLKEPLHVLVEAEFPEDIINARLDHAIAILGSLLKPVDESLDQYKKQQLRELAVLNGTLSEKSPG